MEVFPVSGGLPVYTVGAGCSAKEEKAPHQWGMAYLLGMNVLIQDAKNLRDRVGCLRARMGIPRCTPVEKSDSKAVPLANGFFPALEDGISNLNSILKEIAEDVASIEDVK